MAEKIFYQSSLPRSGSTLIQNLLSQNPDIYATPTSGMMELMYGARANYTESPEFKAQDKDLMRKGFLAFCKSGIEAYCGAITDKKYFIDKSRSWGVHYDLLHTVFAERPKIICLVRDLRDVFCSMEKIFRKNPDKSKSIVNWGELRGTTVAKRMDIWANTAPIGLAIERLQDIIMVKNDAYIHFVRYEDLCLRPEVEMNKIYNYLGIPYYTHNFDFIPQTTKEDDNEYGEYGDHIIRSSLSLTPSTANEVLSPEVCNWIVNKYRWFYNYFGYQVPQQQHNQPSFQNPRF